MVTVRECQEADGAGHRAYKIPSNLNSGHPTEKLLFQPKYAPGGARQRGEELEKIANE